MPAPAHPTLKLAALLSSGKPPEDLQPEEVPSLLRALEVRALRIVRSDTRGLREHARALRRSTSRPPAPAPVQEDLEQNQ